MIGPESTRFPVAHAASQPRSDAAPVDSRSSQGEPSPAARAWGPALFRARLRARSEDFLVDELLTQTFDDAGEHLWLHIEKRGLNTMEVVADLERAFSLGSRDVGVSGLKDRHAITRQWVSLRTPLGVATLEQLPPVAREGSWRVLEARRHGRKLRRGTHSANAFRIVLTDVVWADAADRGALDARIARIATDGFPNRYGAQRFGRHGQNIARAEAMFARGRRGRPPARALRSLLLSAARSALFNDVLDERIRRGDWLQLLDGEPAVLEGSRSYFLPESSDAGESEASDGVADASEELARRIARQDISPSGPLWGDGAGPARGACAELETMLRSRRAVLADGLSSMRMETGRRALRARASELGVVVSDENRDKDRPGALELFVTLASGVYATALLHELGDCRVKLDHVLSPDEGRPDARQPDARQPDENLR